MASEINFDLECGINTAFGSVLLNLTAALCISAVDADRAGWSTASTATPWGSCQQHFQKQNKSVKKTKVTWLLWETGMET